MRIEDISRNQSAAFAALTEVEPAMKEAFPLLASYGYCSAGCHRHDETAGGMLNHALWVMRFAKERMEKLGAEGHAAVPSERSVVLCSLLHDVCDTRYPHVEPPHEHHGGRSSAIMGDLALKFGFSVSDDEKEAVRFHMHGSRGKGTPESRADSDDPAEVLHHIIHKSDHSAIEYAAGIPYGTVPVDVTEEHCESIKEALGYPEGGCIMFVSRFPAYRSSYAMVEKSDGKWIPMEIFSDDVHGLSCRRVNLGEYDTWQEAGDSMRHGKNGRFRIQVWHKEFYTQTCG